MAKTPRMEQIEAMLTDDPGDVMLRYMLGMEYASSGEDESAVRELRALMTGPGGPYVPAFHMAGQALIRLGRESEAAVTLRDGIAAARAVGDLHALGEMQALLSTLE